jgi:hypothetical protein
VTPGGSTDGQILVPLSITLWYSDYKIAPLRTVIRYSQSDVKWDIPTVDEKPFVLCSIALQIKDKAFFTQNNIIKLAIDGVENFIPNKVSAEFNKSGLKLTENKDNYFLMFKLNNAITYTKSMTLQLVANNVITFKCTISRKQAPTPPPSSVIVPYSAPQSVPIAAPRVVVNTETVVKASFVPKIAYIIFYLNKRIYLYS